MLHNCECGWSGVPTYEGNTVPRTRREGGLRPGNGRPTVQCPACAAGRHDELYRSLPRHEVRGHRAVIRTRVSEKVDRNGPCPCGSGRKAKKCCH